MSEILYANDLGDYSYGTVWTPNAIGHFSLSITIDGVTLEEVYRTEVKEAGIPPPPQKMSSEKSQPQNKLRKFRAANSAGLRIRSHPTLQSEQVGIIKMDGIISFIDEVENDDGLWVRLSTESIRQHCQPGWYPLEAWCLQYNQHIDKTLLHPIIEASSMRQESVSSGPQNDTFVDSEATPTSDTHLTAIAPEIVPRKSPSRKNRQTEERLVETNPFKDVFKNPDVEYTESLPLSGKSARVSRNPFEKLTKRSGKVIEDADDLEEYASQDELEKSGVSSVSSSPNYNQGNSKQQQMNIGTWTAGVIDSYKGGSSSKLQAIQKWFKNDSFDGKESPRKRGDFTELASVSVRDLVKAIGGNSNDVKGNSPQQLSQCSSPISIPFSKFLFESIQLTFSSYKMKCSSNRTISVQQ